MKEIEKKLAENGGMAQDLWASRAGLLQMAYMLTAEVQRVFDGKKAHLEEKIFIINLKSMKSSSHSFLPNPLCPICGNLVNDSSTSARISLKPSPKIDSDSYRCRSIDDLKRVLASDYLDQRTGFLNGKVYDLAPPFADVIVNLPLMQGDEGTAGRTHSYELSEITAILEGLERYCGLAPRGKKTVIHDSYRNVKDYALNPESVGIHSMEQYAKPGFPFTPFNPNRPIDWVWGYSFMKEQPILVPEILSYYSLGWVKDLCMKRQMVVL